MHDGIRNRVYKDDIQNQDEFPPTYIVIQFARKIHNEAVQWIICKIQERRKKGGAELLIRKQPDIPGEVSCELKYLY